MLRSVAHTATRPALSLAIDPSAASKGTPLRAIHDARQTSSRAASMSSRIFAKVNAIDWFSMIARPNC